MRRAARIDKTQPEIVEAMRKAGATVAHTHMVSDGFPDLVVGYRGKTALVEVKAGPKEKLTGDQLKWHAAWTGGTLAVVSDVESALRLLKVMEA